MKNHIKIFKNLILLKYVLEISTNEGTSFLSKIEHLNELVDELLMDRGVRDISAERKLWLHRFFGYDNDFEQHFDPASVPSTQTFQKKVNEYFNKQVEKGMVKVEQAEKMNFLLPKNISLTEIKKNASKVLYTSKKFKYNWIPLAEITTAILKIDSLANINPKKREELHKKFATQVVNMISQFDALGDVSDDAITVEQATALQHAFSNAIVEIQRNLFKSITHQPDLETRGSLADQVKRLEDRHARPVRPKSLLSISEEFRTSDKKRDKQGHDMGMFIANLDETQNLPQQYRPVANSTLPKFSKKSFSALTQAVRQEILVPRPAAEHAKSKSQTQKPQPPAPVQTPRKVEILMTPKQMRPPPTLEIKSKAKTKGTKRKLIKLKHFIAPETAFFVEGQKPLDVKLEIQGSNTAEEPVTMLTTKPDNPVSEEPTEEIETDNPEIETQIPKTGDGSYIFRTGKLTIDSLLNTEDLFIFDGDDSVAEHDTLLKLWDQLDLHPDSRLAMASKLCNIVVDDSTGDHNFRTVMEATNSLMEYKKLYKNLKRVFKYDPIAILEEERASLNEMIREYMVAEGALYAINNELTHILGEEIQTSKCGTISEIIRKNNAKLMKIAGEMNICIGRVSVTGADTNVV